MKKIFIIALFLPLLAMAKTSKQYSFLEHGFNIPNYKLCLALLHHNCPTHGMLPQNSCVNQVLAKQQTCAQFRKLATLAGMPAAAVHVSPLGKFALLRIAFLADGQNWYQIITPNGHLINTQVDPRTLSKSLAKKYQKTHFMILNWNEPKYRIYKNGNQTITAELKIKNSCVACPVIGTATIEFNFSKDSLLQKTSLAKYTQSSRE